MPPQSPTSQRSVLTSRRGTLPGASLPASSLARESTSSLSSSPSPSPAASLLSGGLDSSTPGSDTEPTVPDYRLLLFLRSCVLLLMLACCVWSDVLQGWVDVTWAYLRSRAWFTSVYFETWWATLCFALVIPLYPYAFHFLPFMDRYKVDPSVTYVHQTASSIVKMALVYMAPLALLDTVLVKRYWGVDPAEWEERRQHWIQTTRALPVLPPTVTQLAFQVVGGIILYDAMFFLIHLTLHKSRSLYTLLHAYHHQHDVMHAHVTNQLTVGERIMLVLAANQALKILHSHPLSRAAFVPVFVLMLTDNHSGYDFPWGLQHVVPGHVMGGPRAHHAHHMQGTRHYQPFFNYLDALLEWWEGRGRDSAKTC